MGPRVFAAGHFLTTTGGHFLTSGHARECDGPYGFVRAIREQIKNGVDHIKLNLTGGIMGPAWDRHTQSFLLDEELEAAFAICRKRGFPVMAHAANPETVAAAARLGAHSVEHGYIMDDACIEALRAHATWYVPTLAITQLTPDQARDPWEKRWVEQREPRPGSLPARRRRGRAPSRRVPPRARRRRPDGARLRHPPAQGRGPARAGPLGGRGRHPVAGAAGGHPARGRRSAAWAETSAPSSPASSRT